jgi:predicted phage tail protein
MRVIKVYGSLAKFLGHRSFKAAVSTPAEAIRFLLANFPKLEGHMAQHHYKVTTGRLQLAIADHPEVLGYPVAESEPIRIVPVVAGAGSAGGQIAAGIGLIALAILAAPIGGGFLGLGAGAFGSTTGAALGGFTLGAAASSAIGAVGLSLALVGTAQLLTPTAQTSAVTSGTDSFNDPRKSYSFSGIQNVSRQGVPVPIVYGETIVGSVVISSGINTEEIAAS